MTPMFPSPSEVLIEQAALAIEHLDDSPVSFEWRIELRAILRSAFDHLTRRLEEYDRLAMDLRNCDTSAITLKKPRT